MLKKFLSISFVFIAFGFLLSHELIPHHHHDVAESANHEHEHDGEEHAHNFLKCFFSLLHHPEINNVVLISSSVNNELVKSNPYSTGLPFSFFVNDHLDPALIITRENIIFSFDSNFNSSISFRGPPLS